ncbi:hypothetical protein [Bacteroides sp. UBA939]|nr:hypothetical protein [Bacteroides sp. UBA939]
MRRKNSSREMKKSVPWDEKIRLVRRIFLSHESAAYSLRNIEIFAE